jgi:hypothetical protein
MRDYYRTMIENFPEDAECFVQEYKDNTLSIEEMRNIHKQQQNDWGNHTIRDINLKKDTNTGLYYVLVDSKLHQGLLYEHLMLEQLYAQKEHADWQRVTDGYDYREINWIRDLLTNPLVWVPTEEVENDYVVVGKVAREEPRPDAIDDREIYSFCWELEKMGLLWFADTLPVLKDVRASFLKYDNIPEDMILWDRLMCNHLFKGDPRDMRRNINYIAEHRGAAKAAEIVERFREDWQDIITLKLFDMQEAEDFEVQRLHKSMFEEMDRQLRIWKKKAATENENAAQFKVPDGREPENRPDDKVAAAIKAVYQEKICKQADWAVIVRILEEKEKIKKSSFLADAHYINEVCGTDVTNEDSLARSSIFTKVGGKYPYWRIKDGEETRETDGLLRKYKTIGEVFVKALGE